MNGRVVLVVAVAGIVTLAAGSAAGFRVAMQLAEQLECAEEAAAAPAGVLVRLDRLAALTRGGAR